MIEVASAPAESKVSSSASPATQTNPSGAQAPVAPSSFAGGSPVAPTTKPTAGYDEDATVSAPTRGSVAAGSSVMPTGGSEEESVESDG